MSKYGIKIKNFKVGSLYEYNLGLRDNYDYTDAMLINSLFSDFLVKNGLSVWKEESTRDIISNISFVFVNVKTYMNEFPPTSRTSFILLIIVPP